MTDKVLHFTLGPVQGFIADARRLRDFWSGSFMLSLLSGHAMMAVKDAHGHIVFPEVASDPLFLALRDPSPSRAPYVGSLPNRFKAVVPADRADDIGQACKAAVDRAWQAICGAVWQTYVADAAGASADNGTAAEAIWNRQTKAFWDMAWAVGDAPKDRSDGSWLDRRKNWRSHLHPQPEDGDHCRLMGQYQELSGYHRIDEKDRQQAFWDAIRKTVGEDGLDLKQDERLCAIALIKRLFPVVLARKGRIEGAVPFCPGKGLLSIRHWPSTSYVAALPWLRRLEVGLETVRNPTQAYLDAVSTHIGQGQFGEWESPDMFGLPAQGGLERIFKLDGHLLHLDGIASAVKERGPKDEIGTKSVALRTKLKPLCQALGGGQTRLCRASEFYAVLRMDGDRIGSLLRDHSELVKRALATFADRLTKRFDPATDDPIDGVLVYAGGDDALAVLPAEIAIETALELRQIYLSAMADAAAPGQDVSDFTISASIVYAHFKRTPLSAVLRQSVHYLKDVAKKANGRNSLALAVMKPGGVQCDWVSAFESDGGRARDIAQIAAEGFGVTADFANGFFHGFQQKYRTLFAEADDKDKDKDATELAELRNALPPLLLYELRRQFGGALKGLDDPDAAVDRLAGLLRPLVQRPENGAENKEQVVFGAGLIARFLASEVHLPPAETLQGPGR